MPELGSSDWKDGTAIGKGHKSAKDLCDMKIAVLEDYKHQIHTITYDNGLEFAE